MSGWLIFFSSLPSKPVGNRVKVWRTLVRIGAVQLKGAVYVLPAGGENAGLLRRLVAEIGGMGGEAAFLRAERVETLRDAEIVELFDRRKAGEYRRLEGRLEGLERAVDGERQSSRPAAARRLAAQLDRLRKAFGEARRTDFFSSAAGAALATRFGSAQAALDSLTGIAGTAPLAAGIAVRSPDGYRCRRWVTRKSPFVDPMASAWLIRKFVDPEAAFGFVDGETVPAADGTVAFDVTGGEFTHVGDLCTFEVLVRSFALRDPALAEVAAIVHDLDLKDGRHRAPEAAGVEGILSGIRRSARDDADALERGMAVFEMLHAAKGR